VVVPYNSSHLSGQSA